ARILRNPAVLHVSRKCKKCIASSFLTSRLNIPLNSVTGLIILQLTIRSIRKRVRNKPTFSRFLYPKESLICNSFLFTSNCLELGEKLRKLPVGLLSPIRVLLTSQELSDWFENPVCLAYKRASHHGEACLDTVEKLPRRRRQCSPNNPAPGPRRDWR